LYNPSALAYGDARRVRAGPDRGGNRLGAALTLHLVEFAHELGPLVERAAHYQAFADETCPKQGDGKRDRR
jgi:hypothetical protein